MIDIPDQVQHILLKLLCLRKRLFVWIDFHKRLQVVGRLKLRRRIFKLHLVFGQIHLADTVDVILRSADA